MAKVLGLDIGTSSIGWALVDTENHKILKTGVRVFPEGVNRDNKGTEVSKNQSRRLARQARKNRYRKKLRRQDLIRVLKQNSMYPQDPEMLLEWIRWNPYELRAKALSEKLNLLQIGRIFYHINQRRGFKNTRKDLNIEDNKTVIFQGDSKNNKIGIDDTIKAIQNNHLTLGNYLYTLHPHNKPYQNRERIRNRYTLRDMYLEEFEMIWEKQHRYHPEIMTDTLKHTIGHKTEGILFFQLPLKTQKHLIGKCTFEKDKPRCPVSAIPYELFRMYDFINKIEIISPEGENITLTDEQKQKIILLFNTKEKLNFRTIAKTLGYGDAYRFNFDMDYSIPGNHTIGNLIKVFGKNLWEQLTDKDKDDIWHNLYFADDKKWLIGEMTDKPNHRWADKLKQWNFNEDQKNKLASIRLKPGYASLSRKAIMNILPFLKKGFRYSDAVLLGGVKNAFGNLWDSLSEEQIQTIQDSVIDITRKNRGGNSIDQIKIYLRDHYQLNDKQLSKLYHHSHSVDTEKPLLDRLPDPENLRNPIVQQALYEVKNIVNTIISVYGKPDEIRVELARELKASKEQREETLRQLRKKEKQNDQYREELKKLNLDTSRENLQKYILWEECQHICPYTGAEISLHDLFYTGRFQIEHIIPWSVSLNNSMTNKTLCDANVNRAKGDRTPYQFFAQDPQKWAEIKARASKLLPLNKYKLFVRKEEFALDDFISRQLNDTRYISKKAREYLSLVCQKTYVTAGMITSELRHYWGLNSILSDSASIKQRNDHRQHAIDALVIAVTTNAHLQELSRWNKYSKNLQSVPNHNFMAPWKGFYEDAKESILNLFVSHKYHHRIVSTRTVKTRKKEKLYINKGISARGPLHGDTFYGKKTDPTGKIYFTVRKPIDDLTENMIQTKIVDHKIKMLIWARVRQFGLDPTQNFKKPKDLFKEPIYLPNQYGDPVPVKTVRIRENASNLIQINKNINQWVEPDNNDHIIIYERPDGKRDGKIVTFFEAVKRKMAKLPVVDTQIADGKFLFYLRQGETVLWDYDPKKHYTNEELSQKIYVVRKMSLSGNNKTVVLVHHTVAYLNVDKYRYDPTKESFPKVLRKSPDTLLIYKVQMNPLGEIIFP